MTIPISIDRQNCKIIAATGPAAILINQVVKVEISEFGQASTSFEGQWRLTEEDWNRFFQNKGDWTVVNVPILTNAPVQGFKVFEKQARDPIRNRKKNFDDQIKKGIEENRVKEPKKD